MIFANESPQEFIVGNIGVSANVDTHNYVLLLGFQNIPDLHGMSHKNQTRLHSRFLALEIRFKQIQKNMLHCVHK